MMMMTITIKYIIALHNKPKDHVGLGLSGVLHRSGDRQAIAVALLSNPWRYRL
jgi:hypothetical protein